MEYPYAARQIIGDAPHHTKQIPNRVDVLEVSRLPRIFEYKQLYKTTKDFQNIISGEGLFEIYRRGSSTMAVLWK